MARTETGLVQTRRPAGVTVAVILLYLGGAANILVGALTFITARTPDIQSRGVQTPVTIAAVLMILLGIALIVLASAVGRGSNMARKIVTVVLVAALANAVFHYATAGDGNLTTVLQHFAQLVLVGVLLWTGGARRYFQDALST